MPKAIFYLLNGGLYELESQLLEGGLCKVQGLGSKGLESELL